MDNFIIYNTEDGKAAIKLYAENNTVWLTQAQIAELFNTSKQNISLHINNIFADNELSLEATVKEYLTVQTEGTREVNRYLEYYSLDMIMAVGFRVRSPRGVQFRRWANTTLKEFLLKGFVLDNDRLKNPDGRPDYFDELLEQIRDIRASEKRFYQKLRDLFALSVDYDKTEKETARFFADVQNRLLHGVTGMTAAELIVSRADASKPNMALTSWQGSRVRKTDIVIAKNYLTADELDTLNRIVTVFLESAELQAKLRKTLTLDFWRNSTDELLTQHGIPLLENYGSISHESMKEQVGKVYDEFNARRKHEEAAAADADDLVELENDIKRLK